MSPQEFMQFIQEFPEIAPYLEEDEGLMAGIILNPNFREEKLGLATNMWRAWRRFCRTVEGDLPEQ